LDVSLGDKIKVSLEETLKGIVKIKHVYIGLYHYRELHGSVCSPDVRGTPQILKSGQGILRGS